MLDEIPSDLFTYLVPFLEWVDDDWTDCAFLSGPMIRAGHGPQETKQIALEVARYALNQGWVVAGDLSDGGRFKQWPGTPTDWLARLEAEWPEDRNPELWEVGWFDMAAGARPALTQLLEEEYKRRAA